MEEKKITQETDEMLVKYITGTASVQEREKALLWIRLSEENRKYFNKFRDIYEAAKIVQTKTLYDVEKSWERVKSNHYRNLVRNLEQEKAVSRQTTIRGVLKYAAILALALTAGFYGLSLTKDNPVITKEIWSTFEAPYGSRAHLILADSTDVWLNAGSTLKYRSSFGYKDRKVFLNGEAYFDVAHDPDRQFVVSTSCLDVKVFGTEFNVKAYSSENVIQTTLVNGSITIEGDIIGKGGKRKVTLLPNQTATYFITPKHAKPDMPLSETKKPEKKIKSENIEISPVVNTMVYTSWKDSRWFIEGETLKDLAVKLERRYNVKFLFNSSSLANYRFSGTIKDETLEQVLNLMRLSAPINYSIENNTVILTENRYFRKSYDKMLTKPNN